MVVVERWMAANAMMALKSSGLARASCGTFLVKCIVPSLRSYQARQNQEDGHSQHLWHNGLTCQVLYVVCEQSSCDGIFERLAR